MNPFSSHNGIPNVAAAHAGPLTVSSTAVTLATLGVTLHGNTNLVLIRVDAAAIRLTVDPNTAPTATVGFQYTPGSEIWLSRAEAAVVRFIRVSTDATLQVQQYIS